MPETGWYTGTTDNVINAGMLNIWPDYSGHHFGINILGGSSYRFGPVINNYGTWGQLIYSNQNCLAGSDISNPTGFNGFIPMIPPTDNSGWVQGHLVNGECGGSGARAAYLTPISHNMNMRHKGPEAVLQRLVNRGLANGVTNLMFNPNSIPNTFLVYRTHALSPPAAIGALDNVPAGIHVSLGFMVNGIVKTANDLTYEFTQNTGQDPLNPRWFADFYYQNVQLRQRQNIINMINGISIFME